MTPARFFQRIHCEDRSRFLEVLHGLTPANRSYNAEYRIHLNDGTMVVLEEVGDPSSDEDGTLVRLVGVTTEITARKNAEEALWESTAKYRMLLFHSIDQGFFLIDIIFDADNHSMDMLYLKANAAATRMLGMDYTGKRLRGSNQATKNTGMRSSVR